jgi:hypothetical protein
VAEQHKKHLLHTCVVVAGLLSLVWHRAAYPALAPAAKDPQSQDSGTNSAPASASRAPSQAPQAETIFALPPVRIGGSVSYEYRSDWGDGQKMAQQGITGTINARTSTYLWQPWFATLSGELGLSVMRHHSNNGSNVNAFDSLSSNPTTFSSKNLATTGDMQLSVLRRTAFPFQGHYAKTDNRVSATLSAPTGYTSQTMGFTQGYASSFGNGSVGFDRNRQMSDVGGEDRQDSLSMSLSKSLGPAQDIQVTGLQSRNTHVSTDERSLQSNVTVQHRYSPVQALSLDTMGNVSQSAYRLLTGSRGLMGSNETRLMQLNSIGFWRPADQPLTVTGGVRLLGLMMNSDNPLADAATETRMRNANFNLGMNYDFSKAVRVYANGNLSMSNGGGISNRNISESAGISYQPETKQMGEYRYDWSTSANLTNASELGNSAAPTTGTGGTTGPSRSLALQLGHGLSRSLLLDAGSSLSMAVSQGLSSSFRTGGPPVQRITHSGTVSWSFAGNDGSTYVSAGVSDARSLGDARDSFQLINLQASSNLPTGRFSSWRGSLTIQSIRQSAPVVIGSSFNPAIVDAPQTVNSPQTGFVTTSTGAITYQHQRLFGIPRLRLVSDVRMNSQALLPVLSGPLDKESASWDNSFAYGIGRTQLRMNTRMAKTNNKVNKSIMFTAMRTLGD